MLLLCTMSFTIAVRHTFATLLLSLSLTPPRAGSFHPLPDLLLQSGRGRSLAVAPFPSLDLLCGTVCRLNFGSSTVVLHFVDGWSHITFNWLLTNYFINFYNAPLFLSNVYVNGALQIVIIIIIFWKIAIVVVVVVGWVDLCDNGTDQPKRVKLWPNFRVFCRLNKTYLIALKKEMLKIFTCRSRTI